MQTYQDKSDEIIQRICECGWSAYLCGGAVRDHFLEVEAHDYDLVTDATPDILKQIFPDRKVNLVGANFLVTLIDDIEVSTYRSDKNFENGRHNCITSVCSTLQEDLERRDFTFNAMAVCPYLGEVIDPFHGKKDLENKLVKFVGNPYKRINEDYVRILRAARFTCLIEGQLDNAAFNAIRDCKELVKQIAPERIRLELLKVMKYKKPSIFFDVLQRTGVLKVLIPEFDRLYHHTGGKYHSETLDMHSLLAGNELSAKTPLLRLIGYFHDIGKPVVYDGENFIDHEKVGADIIENIFSRFKFTNDEIEKAKNLVKFHMRSISNDISDKAIRRMIKTFSDNNVNWKEWLQIKIADRKANLALDDYTKEHIKMIILKIHNSKKLTTSGEFKVTDLDINGNDVMTLLNIKPGPQVGNILKYLLEQVIENPELNKKENLFELIKGEFIIG